MDKIVISDFTR